MYINTKGERESDRVKRGSRERETDRQRERVRESVCVCGLTIILVFMFESYRQDDSNIEILNIFTLT